MHVAHLTLRNFGPYRGEHTLELGPGVFAVVGRFDDNPNRSNWIGKSWLLGAIRFALYGVKPPGAETEDGWITIGEDEGAVELVLSEGTRIERSRTIGKSTRLKMTPATGKVATQRAAQDQIDELIGFDKSEFAVSAWVGQKDISALVSMQPGDRNRIVDGWLGLDPLRDAEAHAMAEVREANRKAQAARARHTGALAADLADSVIDIDALTKAVADAEAGLREARTLVERIDEWTANADGADRYDEIVDEGTQLKAAIAKRKAELPDVEVLAAKAASANEERAEATEARAACEALIGSPLDGRCPVSLEPCPIADEVSKARDGRLSELEAAKVREGAAKAAAADAGAQADEAAQMAAAIEVDEATLDELREELDGVTAAAEWVEEHPDPPTGDGDVSAWVAKLDTARAALAEAQGTLRAREVAAERAQAALDEAEGAEAQAKAWAAAARLLRGARREIAERDLGTIERGSNGLIADSGIDLSLTLRWEREGRDLAPACLECGEPIRGQKPKVCPACDAPRGRKVIEELEPVLSDRSGAAEDIAGLAMQLAAAAWLRRKRSSEWGSVFIDEPFGSLDESNRTALAAHLQGMLSGRHGFEQAFVVAHDARIMESLPARLVIRNDGTSSRVEVER